MSQSVGILRGVVFCALLACGAERSAEVAPPAAAEATGPEAAVDAVEALLRAHHTEDLPTLATLEVAARDHAGGGRGALEALLVDTSRDLIVQSRAAGRLALYGDAAAEALLGVAEDGARFATVRAAAVAALADLALAAPGLTERARATLGALCLASSADPRMATEAATGLARAAWGGPKVAELLLRADLSPDVRAILGAASTTPAAAP
jgi:hypothetical protein